MWPCSASFFPKASSIGPRRPHHVADLVFVIGISAVVYPAASLPIAARQNGARLIGVNPEQTDVSLMCDVRLLDNEGAILSQFLKERG